MLKIIDVEATKTLDDYAAVAHLAGAVAELRAEAATLVNALEGRTVWMVNSTEQGGGVAEMLPRMVSLLRELGVDTRWAVIGASDPAFFGLTKRIHNLIHGAGDPTLTEADRELFERISRENADDLRRHLREEDILVVHDPQPLGSGALVKQELGLASVWRCHIGLEARCEQTRAVWAFLQPWAEPYDYTVFSVPEYIPDFLTQKSTVIHPAIDPLSHKNRELHIHKVMGIAVDAGLAVPHQPVVTPPFEHQAEKLQADGSWAPATVPEELGMMFRPTIVQISRWDRLKGWLPLLEAFAKLKSRKGTVTEPRHRKRLEILRLIMAGPEPASVTDDPEGLEVLQELTDAYVALPPDIQKDVALVSLPMASRKENALMVNVLQRSATVVVQNSIQEGFGLTCTEAMWKRVPVVTTRRGGLQVQVRDALDGRLVDDPEDTDALADVLDEVLRDAAERELFAQSAQRRAHQHFLLFSQLRSWLELLSNNLMRRVAGQ